MFVTGMDHLEQRLRAHEIELAGKHRAARELARLGAPCASREHLVDPAAARVARPAEPDVTIEPVPGHAEHVRDDRDRARPAHPHDPDPTDSGGGRDRGDRVALDRGHSAAAAAGTTRMWRSSPSPSLRLDNPGISAIAMCTMR